jgi:hypothetical protein
MHVLHFIAVEADTPEEAVSIVETSLNDYDEGRGPFPWSDWSVVGGRWEDEGKVHAYSDDPEKFNTFLERARQNRVDKIENLFLGIEEVESIIDYVRNWDGKTSEYNLDLYRLRQAISIVEDKGKHDQYFYDLNEWTGDFKYVNQRCETDPTRQFLVLVDFHH